MIQLLPNFYGFPCDNPYLHIQKFEELCSTVPNLDIEAVKINFFEQSLQYKASGWFFSLNDEYKRTWQEVQKLFLEKFSPAYEIVLRKQEIVQFTQAEEESYSPSWERYKNLLLSFPDHGFELWRIIEYFYEGLNCETRQFVDMICHGEFLDETEEKGWYYYEQFAKNSQFWVCKINFEDVNSQAREEEPIEPFGVSAEVGLGLNKVSELEWSNELDVQCSPQENFHFQSNIPFDAKTLEESLPIIVKSQVEIDTNHPVESPPLPDFVKVEIIDFLGIDDFDLVYHPFLVNLVNNLKINLIRITHLVELKFLKRLRQLRYSKYLILWHGRFQFLTKCSEWSDMFKVIALHGVVDVRSLCKRGIFSFFIL